VVVGTPYWLKGQHVKVKMFHVSETVIEETVNAWLATQGDAIEILFVAQSESAHGQICLTFVYR
jgi:hypothetical protein